MLGFSRAVLAAALTSAVLSQGALAASTCATDTDMAAFRTAAVQQQLMVAALTCKQVEEYNRFVLAYQPELQKSDADLKAYFIRRGNAAEYDTFKTKLANLSSLSDIANGPAYCANARVAFDMAIKSRQALASFVADQRLMIAMPKQTVCSGSPEPVIETAATQQPPVAAPTKAVAVKALPAPTLVKIASAASRPATPVEAKPQRVAIADAGPKITHEPPPLVVNLVMAPPKLEAGASDRPAARTYAYRDAPAAQAYDHDAEEAADAAPRRAERSRQAERDDENEDETYTEAPLPPRPQRPRSGYYAARYAYYQAQYAHRPLRQHEDGDYYYRGR